MKGRSAPGVDALTAPLFKFGGNRLVEAIQSFALISDRRPNFGQFAK